MKKPMNLLSLLILIIFMIIPSLLRADNNDIYCIGTHDAVTVTASGTSTLPATAIDLRGKANAGFFGVQITLTGTGTGKLEYNISNNNSDYMEPSAATDIVSGFTATSGPGSDGKTIVTFEPELARYLKLKWTETGGANSIVVTTVLCMQ